MLRPALFSALHPRSFKSNQGNISFWLDKEFLQTEELLIIFKWCIQLNRGAPNNLIKKNTWIYFSSTLTSKSNFIYSSQPLRNNWIIVLMPPAAKLKPLQYHNMPGHGTAPSGYWIVSFLWLKHVYGDIHRYTEIYIKEIVSFLKFAVIVSKPVLFCSNTQALHLYHEVTNSSSEYLNVLPEIQYLWGRQSQKVRLFHFRK